MKILIAGASGCIGRNLVPTLADKHDITVLGRDAEKLKMLYPKHHAIDWDGLTSESATDYQLIINLCGENIGDKKWTDQRKAALLKSRVATSKTLCDWALTSNAPQTLRFLNASAVGIYGLNTKHNDEDTTIKEQPDCFTQQIVREWESAVKEKLAHKINYTLMRFGVVLKKHNGMLKKLELPYKMGMASTLGSGQQQMSWVHIDDLVNAIGFIIKDPTLSGPVNVVAPKIITQKQFAKTLANALHRPCFLYTPAFVIKLLLGQLGEELLLSGQEVYSTRLHEAGFVFQFQTAEAALCHEYE